MAVLTPGTPALIATPEPMRGRVLLAVLPVVNVGSEGTQTVEVEVSRDAGAHWVPVRFGAGRLADPAGSFYSDEEVTPRVNTYYRARARQTSGATTVTSAWSQTQQANLAATDFWLHVPRIPGSKMKVGVLSDSPMPSRAQPQAIYSIPDSDREVAVMGQRGKRVGSLTFRIFSRGDWQAFNSILDLRTTLFLQDPTGEAYFFIPGDLAPSRVKKVGSIEAPMYDATLGMREVAGA